MKSTIKLTNIKAIGRHGANPGEQDTVQTFYVDLEITVNIRDDEIEQTQDYREIVEVVKRLVEQKQFKLIETMALFIARKVGGLNKVEYVKATVHKPAAAKSLLLEDVSATAEYSRNEQ